MMVLMRLGEGAWYQTCLLITSHQLLWAGDSKHLRLAPVKGLPPSHSFQGLHATATSVSKQAVTY